MKELKGNQIATFSVANLSRLLGELKEPSPIIYWADYLGSYTLGMILFITAVQSHIVGVRIGLMVISILGFYRALGFLHETVHQKNQPFMKFFIPVWNLFSGSLFFMPSTFYLCHLKHHSTQHYGTVNDPQYANFLEKKPPPVVFLIVQSIVPPVFFSIRSLLIAPISLLISPIRPFVLQYLSAFAEPGYVADYTRAEKRQLVKYEMTNLLVWGIIFLLTGKGMIPLLYLKCWIIVLFTVYALNGFRILGEHKYDYGRDEASLSREEIFFDSYNYTSLMSELIYTTGLRYHALHHLMASIPYHNLPKAHKRIVEAVGGGTSYESVSSASHLQNLAKLFSRKSPDPS